MTEFEPFLGRIVLKTINEDKAYEEWYELNLKKKSGVSENSQIIIPKGETDFEGNFQLKDKHYDIRKGVIIKKAEDAFGERFQRYYGSDRKTVPQIGDTVYYVPGKQYRVGFDLDIVCINDDDVMGYIKATI